MKAGQLQLHGSVSQEPMTNDWAEMKPMKAATALFNLKHCSYQNLPTAPGVLLIMCKQASGQFAHVDHMKCDDIRKKAESLGDNLTYACGGELAYWTCTEADKTEEAWNEAERLARR